MDKDGIIVVLYSARTDGELYGGVLQMLDVLLSPETNEAEDFAG